jgi:hypothetical protein
MIDITFTFHDFALLFLNAFDHSYKENCTWIYGKNHTFDLWCSQWNLSMVLDFVLFFTTYIVFTIVQWLPLQSLMCLAQCPLKKNCDLVEVTIIQSQCSQIWLLKIMRENILIKLCIFYYLLEPCIIWWIQCISHSPIPFELNLLVY